MMSDAEVEEALEAIRTGTVSRRPRQEIVQLARLALLSLRETRKKLREYRDRERARIPEPPQETR